MDLFEEARRCLIHAKRVKIYPKNILLAKRIIRTGRFVLQVYVHRYEKRFFYLKLELIVLC